MIVGIKGNRNRQTHIHTYIETERDKKQCGEREKESE